MKIKKIFQKSHFVQVAGLLAILTMNFTFSGCIQPSLENEQGSTAFGESGNKGLLKLLLTDFPIKGNEVSKVLITIKSIEIHSETQGWIPVVDYVTGRVFDLLTLQNGKTADLGELSLEPGVYNQIRIHLSSDNQIEVDEGNGPTLKPLKIPSGQQTGIKLVHPFEVTKQGVTALTLDFNAEKSVIQTGKKYQLKPTIKIIAAKTTPGMSKLISAVDGGSLIILGKIEVHVPPGALSQDTRIEIVPKKATDLPSMFASYRLLPDVYDLKPDGLQFNEDITVSMNYDQNDILSMGLPETGSKPFFYDVNSGHWQIMAGLPEPLSNLVHFPTNHFTNFGIGAGSPSGPPVINVADVGSTLPTGAPETVWAEIDLNGAKNITEVKAFVAYEFTTGASTVTTAYHGFSLQNSDPKQPNRYFADIPTSYDDQSFAAHMSDISDSTTIKIYLEVTGIDKNGFTLTNCAPLPASGNCMDAANDPYTQIYVPDSDADGMNDLWESVYFLDIGLDDSLKDPDKDGKTNLTEFQKNQNPIQVKFVYDHSKNFDTMYWEQRLQLLQNLVEVGNGHGMSTPSGGKKNGSKMAYGDNTIKLGWYIGVLATEYKRLKMAGQNTAPTLHELYFALKAMERLDQYAEEFHHVVLAGKSKGTMKDKWKKPNGFFMRDDMTLDTYLTNFYPKKWHGEPEKKKNIFVSMNISSPSEKSYQYRKHIGTDERLAFEMSQDQVIHLLMGLTLVQRYIPANAQINNESVLKMAEDIAFQIGRHLERNEYFIRNPVNGKTVNVGGEAIVFSGAIAKTLSYITGFSMLSPIMKDRDFWYAQIGILAIAGENNIFYNRAMAAILISTSEIASKSSVIMTYPWLRDIFDYNGVLGGDKHHDTWVGAEKVFGLIHGQLYHKKPWKKGKGYSRKNIHWSITKLLRRNNTYSSDKFTGKGSSKKRGLHRLEDMLFMNLYDIIYKENGLKYHPMYKEELSRQINRSSNILANYPVTF